MGGGGGWSLSSLGDIRTLEDKAKEALRQGNQPRKNVFISFAYEDLSEVNLFRGQAKNENNDIEFNDHSVREPYNSERAEYIKQKIRERIERCSTTVVYLSKDTPASEWVRWEVEKSVELGKRVIAFHAGDRQPSRLPSWVGEHKVKVVPWTGLSAELRKG